MCPVGTCAKRKANRRSQPKRVMGTVVPVTTIEVAGRKALRLAWAAVPAKRLGWEAARLWRAAPPGAGLKRRSAPLPAWRHAQDANRSATTSPTRARKAKLLNPERDSIPIRARRANLPTPKRNFFPNPRPQPESPKPGARLTRAAIASAGKNPRRFWARIRTHTAQP